MSCHLFTFILAAVDGLKYHDTEAGRGSSIKKGDKVLVSEDSS
jgi:FKBP-type peptidyl-prolyl cis-trans isomerase